MSTSTSYNQDNILDKFPEGSKWVVDGRNVEVEVKYQNCVWFVDTGTYLKFALYTNKPSELLILQLAQPMKSIQTIQPIQTVPDKTTNPDEGRKYDSGKPMYNLLPAEALDEVVKVLTYGAIKYNEPLDQENWRLVSNPHPRYFAASQRHLWADKRGEFKDNESGLYHLAHAISGLLFKLQLRIENEQNKQKGTNNV